VLDDVDGITEQLDANMQKSVDAYCDPWQDGRDPMTEAQFRTSLPLLPLPRVPVR
jgi:nitrite reductase (NADH) large subunit